MPVFDICKVGSTADCATMYVEDKTVYGVAPDDRLTYALFLVGFFYQEGLDDIRVNVNNLLPESVVTWNVTTASDGYYYFDLLPIVIWTSAIVFTTGEICYQNTFYWKAITNGANSIPTNTEGVNWEKIPDPYTEVVAIPNVLRYNTVTFCRGNACYGEVVSKAAETCNNCSEGLNKDFIKVDVQLNAGYVQLSQRNYVKAHKTALLLQNICADLNDCGC